MGFFPHFIYPYHFLSPCLSVTENDTLKYHTIFMDFLFLILVLCFCLLRLYLSCIQIDNFIYIPIREVILSNEISFLFYSNFSTLPSTFSGIHSCSYCSLPAFFCLVLDCFISFYFIFLVSTFIFLYSLFAIFTLLKNWNYKKMWKP